MKKHVTAILVALWFMGPAIPAQAARLVCDPQAGVTSYKVDIYGAGAAISVPAKTDGSLDYSLNEVQPGAYEANVAACVGSGVWEACSGYAKYPFEKPNLIVPQTPAGLRLTK